MKEKIMRRFAIAFVIIGLATAAYAQRGGPETGRFVRVGLEAAVVKGAPYSAEVVNESVQVLSDGNRIVHRSTSRVYRDSEGRTRREEDRPAGSPAIVISDPVSGNSWNLDVDSRIARQNSSLPFIFGGNVNRGGELDRVNVLINGQLSSFVARGGGNGSGLWLVGPGNEQSVEEKLAARTIEGLRVEGVRRTMTIPVGAIGNERPIVVTSEEWTSPDLKVQVLSESNDPRTGTSTYKLVNVKRGDPAASLFQVPPDYTIQQGAGRGEGRGEGRGGARGAPQR
jgi:hypothetical protein